MLSAFKEHLFPAGDATVLAEKIEAIMKMTTQQRKELALLMRKEVEQRFTLQQMLDGHEGIYTKLVGK